MTIDVSRERKRDTGVSRYQPEPGRVSLESAQRGELNGIGCEASACI